MKRRQRPSFLNKYAAHARISRQAAAEQLQRVGVDYSHEFDFKDADSRRAASRHASRLAFAAPIGTDPIGEEGLGDEAKNDQTILAYQREREKWKAKLTELDYQERIGDVVAAADVDREWFELARLVRDSMLNLPARLADQLAHETDQRKVHDLLEQEIYRALEGILTKAESIA